MATCVVCRGPHGTWACPRGRETGVRPMYVESCDCPECGAPANCVDAVRHVCADCGVLERLKKAREAVEARLQLGLAHDLFSAEDVRVLLQASAPMLRDRESARCERREYFQKLLAEL